MRRNYEPATQWADLGSERLSVVSDSVLKGARIFGASRCSDVCKAISTALALFKEPSVKENVSLFAGSMSSSASVKITSSR